MNRIKSIVKSRPAANVAVIAVAAVAVIYSVPQRAVGTDPVTVAVEQLLGDNPPQSSTGWDLPNLQHARVDTWVKTFSTNPKVKSNFAVWLQRLPKYEAMISAKLTERDMPQDLIYLAMIESGFNPTAKSPAAAGGLWQFISETGQRYGLTVNKRVDERNHPEKATEAALSYLSDLHDRFGSWYLAAAAYNTGENRVGRIMRQVTGSEKGTDADYYRISNLLPRETRDYVPKMIAAARISKDPGKYGFPSHDIAMAE